jgi:hypothetical protein
MARKLSIMPCKIESLLIIEGQRSGDVFSGDRFDVFFENFADDEDD